MKKILVTLFVFVTSHCFSQNLRLAVYQYADNSRIQNLQPLADLLQQQLGIKATVKSYPAVPAFIEAIQNGEVDVAFTNAFGYMLLEANGKRCPMLPKVALIVPDADDNDKTMFVTRVGSPVQQLRDALAFGKQTRLGLVAVDSTCGNLVPRLALTRIGIANAEQTFQSVTYRGTNANVLQALLQNEVDLGAMGSGEYAKLDSATKLQLKPIWVSTEIPLGPVLFNKKLSKSLQQQIENVLLTVHQQAPAVLESIKAGWSEAKQATHFEELHKESYLPFQNQFGSTKTIEPILKQFAN